MIIHSLQITIVVSWYLHMCESKKEDVNPAGEHVIEEKAFWVGSGNYGQKHIIKTCYDL